MDRLYLIGALLYLFILPVSYAEDDTEGGSALEVYGKVHVSTEYADDGLDEFVNISSNASRLGVRGSKDLIRELKGIYQIETGIDITGQSHELIPRNRFAGLAGKFGTVLMGIYDTPFKQIARIVDVFSETVGDSRNILGNYAIFSEINHFNVRAKNALMYKSPKAGGVQFSMLYATDFMSVSTECANSGYKDDQNCQLGSTSLSYDEGPIFLAIGYETRQDDSGMRLVARVQSDNAFASFVYESLASKAGSTVRDRAAYAFNGAYHFGLVSLALQYQIADEHELSGSSEDSGANLFSAGVFQSMSKDTRVYLVFSTVNNGVNSAYGLGAAGHGQRVATNNNVPGYGVKALSVGMIHKF